MKPKRLCCFCNQPVHGYGHNPDTAPNRLLKMPIGRCCDICNVMFVIPERIKRLQQQ